ncbi:iron transporter FeoB [Peptococcaceae bacterium SCADC1_2_3]|nr:iron transporter FeoB [Peptococcaceae bacterium SCADC1_2_3]KFI34807.1 iron transporter FeoB [Peptococcaceae bacterium SCADC1_2_3]KFI36462.1 iron transporter FeoB [Peptococcaceae bacterium SCADC1_2_3]KFI37354.1 iron transporter FeoB [Peptococcaceae bacterium SCADC1_2_3]
METGTKTTETTAKAKSEKIIALAGNPNSGKTSIFNDLTGSHQQVGNWPGVTVEKKEGKLTYQGEFLKVVDLPGTYSLGGYTEDELIARNFILFDQPSVIINVVDSANLERNLYLTVQLLEMGANIVVALNMVDEAKAQKIEINKSRLTELLGVPVVPTVATRNEGVKELVAATVSRAKELPPKPLVVNYGQEIEEELLKLEELIKLNPNLNANYSSRWLAVKLLEGDERLRDEMQKCQADRVLVQTGKSIHHLINILGEELEAIIAERRYGFISGLLKEVVSRRSTLEERLTVSDKIDQVVTNRFLGLPLFLLAMWAVFQFTFKLGDPLIGWVEAVFEGLGGLVTGWLGVLGASEMLVSFVVDGIIGGVGSVLVFIPPIFLLFLALSFLEDSGYMARAAYIMDRFMHFLGLHGKSFLPLLIGFGCNVPAIMATRTLESRQDRLVTILINPLMSCAARLPVYVLFAGAFFTANQGWVIFSLYLLGIVLAIMIGKLFKTFIFKGGISTFVMELPPYRLPTLKSIFIHMWQRGSSFIRKAGTIILGVVVLVWLFSNLPPGVEYASQESIIGKIGSVLAPLFTPAGFGNWEAAAALIFGILAKEVVVGTLGVLYGMDEAGLSQAIAQHWTPLSAYAFMVMTLIYIPCVAAIGAIRRETNSWGWTVFAIAYSLVLGWVMAVLVFQGGRLLGLG